MRVSIHVGKQGDRKGLPYISPLLQHIGETLAVSLHSSNLQRYIL